MVEKKENDGSKFVIIRKESKEKDEFKSNLKKSEGEIKGKKSAFAPLIGRRVVVQQVRHGTIYEGELIDYVEQFLVLRNAKVSGTKNIVETDLLYINRNFVAHIHAEPKTIVEKK
jgi:hypothetical protein